MIDNTINTEKTMRVPALAGGGAKRFRVGDEILGRYVIESELGQGGMGVVYLCLDRVGGVKVAVKGLPPEVSHNVDEKEAVRDNFQLVSELQHPNIAGARTLEKDAETGTYFLVMTYARGVSLKHWLRKNGGREHRPAQLNVLRQIAFALDCAHAGKVIHRDVKPSNVMVDESGKVMVLDFGIAAQMSQDREGPAATSRSGTPAYMSPEQWMEQAQGAASDQYALGAIAYLMFAGKLPFEFDDIGRLKRAVVSDPVPRIRGEGTAVNAVFAKVLAKSPRERFASCGEFVAALEGAGSGDAKAPSGKRRLAGAGALFVIAAFLGVGGWWIGRSTEGEKRPSGPRPGELRKIDLPGGATMEMVWCPPGSFMMGSPASEKGRRDDERPRRVSLDKGFWMGRYEVTQRQWKSVMGGNPSEFRTPDRPVEQVSWEECREFIRKINDAGEVRVDLPTEAQWEYACRAGTETPFSFGLTLNGVEANCDGHNPYGTTTIGGFCRETEPVGSYAPNGWGLYDMHGNVFEWCADRHGSGRRRVCRGGGWSSDAHVCRSARRCSEDADNRSSNLGLRLVECERD